jgi:hypothetical protein
MAANVKTPTEEGNRMETEVTETPENWETRSVERSRSRSRSENRKRKASRSTEKEEGKKGKEKNPKKEQQEEERTTTTEEMEMEETTSVGEKTEENNRAGIIKKLTVETSRSLTEIAKAIKKEMGGKISFTKEDQKRILSASGDIKSSITELLLEVIGMQEETRRAEERARKAENQIGKLEEQIRQLTERQAQRRTEGEKKDLRGPSQRKLDLLRKELHQEAMGEEGAQKAHKTSTEVPPGNTPTPAPRKRKPKKQEGEWNTVSYAQKLKAKIPERHETLVSTEGQSEAEVKKTLSGLSIQEIGGPLAQVVSRKDGSLLLVSQSEEQKKRLEETLKKKQGLQVKQMEKLNPTITLTGLGMEWKPEEVVREIWEKNEWIRRERTREQFTAEVKVLSRRVCKDPKKQNVVLTMDTKTQEECLKRKKAVVGLTLFWMEEKFEINRCFNCHGYGHQRKDCKQERTCYRCGGAHLKKDCKEEKTKCPNCIKEGRKDVNHQATDRGCPVYKRRLEIKVGRTARN